MNRILMVVMALSLNGFACVLTTEEKREKIAAHNEAFQALNERVRDPFVLKGPDGWFYITGTTA